MAETPQLRRQRRTLDDLEQFGPLWDEFLRVLRASHHFYETANPDPSVAQTIGEDLERLRQQLRPLVYNLVNGNVRLANSAALRRMWKGLIKRPVRDLDGLFHGYESEQGYVILDGNDEEQSGWAVHDAEDVRLVTQSVLREVRDEVEAAAVSALTAQAEEAARWARQREGHFTRFGQAYLDGDIDRVGLVLAMTRALADGHKARMEGFTVDPGTLYNLWVHAFLEDIWGQIPKADIDAGFEQALAGGFLRREEVAGRLVAVVTEKGAKAYEEASRQTSGRTTESSALSAAARPSDARSSTAFGALEDWVKRVYGKAPTLWNLLGFLLVLALGILALL